MVVIRPMVIIDQECDVNIFIMGIIYPKIMCPNCVHTKLSCSDGDGEDDDDDDGLADVPVLLLHCSHRGKILHGISTGLFHGVSSSSNSKDSLGSNSPRFVQRRL